ncbi:MAG TPA: PIG-L family deacetylase [Pirellulales bacterium]|nr:PIG-L family deacetylase [Pirellulales bacterium]
MKRTSLISVAAARLAIGFSLSAVIGLISPSDRQFATAARAAEDDKAPAPPPADDGKLRILCFGAHPDDCELRVAGTAALWAAQGHHVKFVSVTNGDIGHWREAGGPLAQRRKSEVARADAMLHVTSQVLDIHDGELLPTIENRRTITRLIRRWNADVVTSHRPNDYHPDHRYTGVLVQDAAYMVTVPYFCPDTPHLRKNPVFLFYPDRFQKPNPFQADVAVSIDSVMETKLQALAVMESQFYEGGANGSAELTPDDPARQAERRRQVREGFAARSREVADRFRAVLSDGYGAEAAAKIEFAEAFEICEYGRQPSKAELRQLFPFSTAP